MTRDEAIVAIKAGYVMRHEIFRYGFCIYMVNGKTHNSDGNKVWRRGHPFLNTTSDSQFNNGWDVVSYGRYWCLHMRGYINKPFPFLINYYKNKQ